MIEFFLLAAPIFKAMQVDEDTEFMRGLLFYKTDRTRHHNQQGRAHQGKQYEGIYLSTPGAVKMNGLFNTLL